MYFILYLEPVNAFCILSSALFKTIIRKKKVNKQSITCLNTSTCKSIKKISKKWKINFRQKVDKILHKYRPLTNLINIYLASEPSIILSKMSKQRMFCNSGVFVGFCPIFTNEGYLQWSPCKDTACPTSSYRSDEVYQCKDDVSVFYFDL